MTGTYGAQHVRSLAVANGELEEQLKSSKSSKKFSANGNYAM